MNFKSVVPNKINLHPEDNIPTDFCILNRYVLINSIKSSLDAMINSPDFFFLIRIFNK